MELLPTLPEGKIVFSELIITDIKMQKPIEVIKHKWDIANRYVAKHAYSSSIKIPYKFTPYKSLGLFAYNLYEVVKEVYVDYKGIKRHDTGVTWFNHCLLELCLIEINDCIAGVDLIENSWKKSFIDSESKKLAKLKKLGGDFINPYRDYPYAVNLIELMDCVIQKATDREGDVFIKKYWKPFLKSYSVYINDLKKHPQIKHGYIESDGSYILQIGKGKSPANKRKLLY